MQEVSVQPPPLCVRNWTLTFSGDMLLLLTASQCQETACQETFLCRQSEDSEIRFYKVFAVSLPPFMKQQCSFRKKDLSERYCLAAEHLNSRNLKYSPDIKARPDTEGMSECLNNHSRQESANYLKMVILPRGRSTTQQFTNTFHFSYLFRKIKVKCLPF